MGVSLPSPLELDRDSGVLSCPKCNDSPEDADDGTLVDTKMVIDAVTEYSDSVWLVVSNELSARDLEEDIFNMENKKQDMFKVLKELGIYESKK